MERLEGIEPSTFWFEVKYSIHWTIDAYFLKIFLTLFKILEELIGLEPMNRSFADFGLNHLATVPFISKILIIFF